MKVRINEYELKTPKVSSCSDILMISDIHSNIKALKTISKILTKDVKFIVIVGDTLDSADCLNNEFVFNELKVLSERIPVVITLGNHDTVKFVKNKEIPTDDLSFFNKLDEETNCIVLKDKYQSFKIDNEVFIHAINMPISWYQNGENKNELYNYLSSLKYSIDYNHFNILLSHSPNGIIDNNKINNSIDIIRDSDLILSGHNHGGLTPIVIQNLSKKNMGLVGPYYKLKQANAYGFWSCKNNSLILSNGITKASSSSKVSLLSPVLNMAFVPDIELIHLSNGVKHQLSFQKRKIYNVK